MFFCFDIVRDGMFLRFCVCVFLNVDIGCLGFVGGDICLIDFILKVVGLLVLFIIFGCIGI